MERRHWLLAAISSFFSWLLYSQAAESAAKEGWYRYTRVFEFKNYEWREIVWEEMAPGKQYILIGINSASVLYECSVISVKGLPNPWEIGSPVELETHCPLAGDLTSRLIRSEKS